MSLLSKQYPHFKFIVRLASILGVSFTLLSTASEASPLSSGGGRVGSFEVGVSTTGQITVSERGKIRWQSAPGKWLVGATQALEMHENRGSFRWQENITSRCETMSVKRIVTGSDHLTLLGHIAGDERCESQWTMTFRQVGIGHLQFNIDFDNPAVNATFVRVQSRKDERIHGMGEQFSHLNLKGHQVPVLAQEGGVGRGHPVISPIVDAASPGSGGDVYSTYYAVPMYMSSHMQSMLLENTEFSVFDFRRHDVAEIRLFRRGMTARILSGDSWLELVERFTDWSGRMRSLPDWFNEGAVIGIQGGTAKVNAILNEFYRRGTPIAGVWLQDWVGKRKTAFGSQLWWNWELDRDHYPDWDKLVDRIESKGGRMLCYMNAFLVDATPKGNVRRNLYQEAVTNGYLVKQKDGKPYQVKNTDFDAGMIDFTNTSAVSWLKQVMRDQVINEGRCGGWMHDFGEALPFDAILSNGKSAAEYHNQYAVDWMRVGREAIDESGRGNDIVLFNRAGYSKTPEYSTLVWQGDQLVTWDAWDGFQSALTATITSGFSGISLTHADIGGYTNASLGKVGYNREEELLLRWMEFSAFTAAFRTHEGLRPDANVQAYSNDKTMTQFDRFARVFKALAPYRKKLMAEAETRGWPLVRHPMLHYGNDGELAELKDHFMLGDEILVAPIVSKNTLNHGWKKVYFPDAENTTWVNIFTGKTFGKNGNTENPAHLQAVNPATGRWHWVHGPIGYPAAFYRQGSEVGAELAERLKALGVK